MDSLDLAIAGLASETQAFSCAFPRLFEAMNPLTQTFGPDTTLPKGSGHDLLSLSAFFGPESIRFFWVDSTVRPGWAPTAPASVGSYSGGPGAATRGAPAAGGPAGGDEGHETSLGAGVSACLKNGSMVGGLRQVKEGFLQL